MVKIMFLNIEAIFVGMILRVNKSISFLNVRDQYQ